jgi:hypothetical protein
MFHHIFLKTTVLLQGTLAANASTFPSRIMALADYMHGKRLKLGIHVDAMHLTEN